MKRTITVLCVCLGLAAGVRGADVSVLVKQLKAADEDERRGAAKSLAELGPEAKPALAALTESLKDSDLFVRRFAAQALGEIGPDAAKAVPSLQALLGDPKKEVAAAAAVSLGKVGPEGVKVLGEVLKDDKKPAESRRRAVLGLAKAGPDVKPVLPQLADLLSKRDLQGDVVSALGELGPHAKDDKVVKALQDLRDDKGVQREFRARIQDTLRKINAKDKP